PRTWSRLRRHRRPDDVSGRARKTHAPRGFLDDRCAAGAFGARAVGDGRGHPGALRPPHPPGSTDAIRLSHRSDRIRVATASDDASDTRAAPAEADHLPDRGLARTRWTAEVTASGATVPKTAIDFASTEPGTTFPSPRMRAA